ncbi:MAG: DnaJ domain-containing protein [Verrucomicrobia bacterium]|nr:DnaJ domain-containing protein [Verrucomicrobiota bacterium]MDE3099739.1 DnaJ domain-containing protein [Verrucomicrobiota bacterium]
MADYFVLLGVPRRPWLEPELLKKKMTALAGQMHPDKVANGDKAAATTRFSELNAALQCLMDPKSRLRHLIELESGSRPAEIQQVPAALADLFVEVASACKQADALLAAKKQAASPLLQARQFQRALHGVEHLHQLQNRFAEFQNALDEQLKSLDAAWTASNASPRRLLPRLEELYRLFGYLNRWTAQLRERSLQLTL